MPVTGGQALAPQNRSGGRWVDSMYSRFMSTTFKDPEDLKLKIMRVEFFPENEEENESEEEIDETLLPFDEDEYFDINSDDELFIPSHDFYYDRVKKISPFRSDLDVAIKKPRPTTPGLGTGRLSARQRGGRKSNYPGGPSQKLSLKQLRKLIRSEVKNNYIGRK